MMYLMTYWDVTYKERYQVRFINMDVALKVMQFRLENPHLYTELTLNALKDYRDDKRKW